MRRRWLVFALLLLAATGCESAGIGGGGGYRNAHTLQWHEAKSKHFTIYGADPEATLRLAAQRLELFHSVAEFVSGRKFPPPKVPVTIFSFERTSTLQAFSGHRWIEATITQSMRRNMFMFSLQRLGRDNPYKNLQRAYTAFLLDNHGRYAYPNWYQWGFSQFLAQSEVLKDGRVEIGGIPGRRGRQHLPYMGSAWRPLRQIFTATHGERISGYQFRAESWALIHYFNFGDLRKGAQRNLTRYFRYIDDGRDPAEAVRPAFRMSPEDLDRKLRSYVMKKEYQSAVFEASMFPHEDAVQIRAMTTAEVASALGALSLDAGISRELWRPGYGAPKFEQAQHYYEAGLATGSGDRIVPRAGVARALLGRGRVDEAEAMVDELMAESPEHAEVQLVKGQVDQRRASDSDDSALRSKLARAARKHYVKSWKLDASVPETYAMYGSTYLLDGQDAKKGLQTLKHAKDLLPASHGIRLLLAQLYLKAGDKESARKVALSIAYSTFGEEMDKQVEKLLDATEDVELNPDA